MFAKYPCGLAWALAQTELGTDRAINVIKLVLAPILTRVKVILVSLSSVDCVQDEKKKMESLPPT